MDERQRKIFARGLDQYFSAYDSSQALASDLIRRKEHPTDLLVLLCARLDALASDARGDNTNTTHRETFCTFLTHYAGERKLFEAVSVPDLYYELGYYRWRLEGTIPAPGRLHKFTKLDVPLLHLIEGCGLPITLKEIGKMLDTLARILEQNYRVKARQAPSKLRTASVVQLKKLIENAARETKLRKIADQLPQSLHPLLAKLQVCNILYERFRCESIHGATVLIDTKRFFSESGIYWKRIYPVSQRRTYELVEFPAAFLLQCLKRCITTYRAHLMVKGKVPHAIYFYGFDDLWSTRDYLDVDSLEDGGRVPLKLEK